MLVVCEKSIYIIGFPNFSSIDSINLGEEKRKKIAFAFSLEQQVNKLAFNIINNNENVIKINSYDAENRKMTIEMKSNLKPNNLIKFMEFNKKGKILAVAVKHYPYVELFNTETGFIICKCQIESDNLNIKYISFSQNNDFLCCFCESGEANIFNIKSAFDIQEEENDNKNIELKIWTKFYLPENKVICTFANFLGNEQEKNNIICIGTKGNYYLVKFNKDKSQNLALKVCEKYFLKNDIEQIYEEEFA
jgi:WD40 repeat protein